MLKAIVAVRGGSVRVQNKNIRPFAGSSLLEIKIRQLMRIEEIDEVIVSSDSWKMLEIAQSLGATPMKRDPSLASSEASINDVWEHLASSVECEHVIYTNVTNPLVEDETYRECIKMYFDLIEEGYDSLNTCTPIKEFLWQDGKPLNYDADNQPRSQDLPDIFFPNFAISLIRREDMVRNRSIFGERFFPYKMGKIESIDIDDEEDFAIAEALFDKFGPESERT